MCDKNDCLEDQLNKHPMLKERFKAILKLVEDTDGNVEKADEAEMLAIEQVRKLGNEILHDWAISKAAQKKNEKQSEGNAIGNGKKNSTGTRRSVK